MITLFSILFIIVSLIVTFRLILWLTKLWLKITVFLIEIGAVALIISILL